MHAGRARVDFEGGAECARGGVVGRSARGSLGILLPGLTHMRTRLLVLVDVIRCMVVAVS